MLDNDKFYDCSQFLLGIPLPQIQRLSWDQAVTYCDALQTGTDQGELAALERLLELCFSIDYAPIQFQAQVVDDTGPTSLWPIAQKLIGLWYTGTWDGIDALSARDPVNYSNLLSWVLAPDQHAMGVPKGQSYWSQAPANTEGL